MKFQGLTTVLSIVLAAVAAAGALLLEGVFLACCVTVMFFRPARGSRRLVR